MFWKRPALPKGQDACWGVNFRNSSLAKISDIVILLDCGLGVAATKSFRAQYTIMLRIAEGMAGKTGIDQNAIGKAISRNTSTF